MHKIALTAATITALAATAGCDPYAPGGDGSAAAPVGGGGGTVALPRAIAGTRAVERDRLILRLEVSGEAVQTSRVGDVWVAEFRLADDRDYEMSARWSYALEDTEIVLAQSETLRINRANAGRITISRYDTLSFDEDGDGVSNLAEIDAGRDPLVRDAPPLLVLGPGQGNCRDDTRWPTVPARDQDVPRTTLILDEAQDESFAPSLLLDQQAYFLTLYLEEAGEVLVEHTGGEPAVSDAYLYDRRADATAALDDTSNLEESYSSIGEPGRARAGGPLSRGLYCYVLFAAGGASADYSDVAPLRDVVIRVSFTPTS